MKYLILLTTLFLFISCGQDLRSNRAKLEDASSAGLAANSAEGCGCNFEYNPVCAENGKTFDSPCVANCYQVPYTFGACKGGDGSLNCSTVIDYVCAQPPMPECSPGEPNCSQLITQPKAYLNLCSMVENGASYISRGVCP